MNDGNDSRRASYGIRCASGPTNKLMAIGHSNWAGGSLGWAGQMVVRGRGEKEGKRQEARGTAKGDSREGGKPGRRAAGLLYPL